MYDVHNKVKHDTCISTKEITSGGETDLLLVYALSSNFENVDDLLIIGLCPDLF